MVVDWHWEETSSHCTKHLQCPDIGRRLDRDEVSRFQQGASNEVQPLLRAGDNEDLVGTAADPPTLGPGSNRLAERGIALTRAVLEKARSFAVQRLVEELPDNTDRIELRSWESRGKADHVGARGGKCRVFQCWVVEK